MRGYITQQLGWEKVVTNPFVSSKLCVLTLYGPPQLTAKTPMQISNGFRIGRGKGHGTVGKVVCFTPWLAEPGRYATGLNKRYDDYRAPAQPKTRR